MGRTFKSAMEIVEEKIASLESKIERLREKNEGWRIKYNQLSQRYETLKGQMVNTSELDALRLENAKLLTALNSMKRKENTAHKKMQEIQQIINRK